MHDSNTGSVAIDQCVVDVLESARFPEPADDRPMAVRYPLIMLVNG